LFREFYFVFNGLWSQIGGIRLIVDLIDNSEGVGQREEVFLRLGRSYLDGKTLIGNGKNGKMIIMLFGNWFILVKARFDFRFPFIL
jgi:hypothetical protein